MKTFVIATSLIAVATAVPSVSYGGSAKPEEPVGYGGSTKPEQPAYPVAPSYGGTKPEVPTYPDVPSYPTKPEEPKGYEPEHPGSVIPDDYVPVTKTVTETKTVTDTSVVHETCTEYVPVPEVIEKHSTYIVETPKIIEVTEYVCNTVAPEIPDNTCVMPTHVYDEVIDEGYVPEEDCEDDYGSVIPDDHYPQPTHDYDEDCEDEDYDTVIDDGYEAPTEVPYGGHTKPEEPVGYPDVKPEEPEYVMPDVPTGYPDVKPEEPKGYPDVKPEEPKGYPDVKPEEPKGYNDIKPGY